MLKDFVHSNRIAKSDFKECVSELRAQLLETQNKLRSADFPVIIHFAGVDGAGKSDVVNLLNEWMDPRFLINRAYVRQSESESQRPEFWRYWRDLPPKGQMGLFLSAWYSPILLDMVDLPSPHNHFEQRIERVRRFEKTLAQDGALILKFWMHLDKKQQKKRLSKLQSNPDTAWRVTTTDWAHWALYDRFVEAADTLIATTGTELAPWQVIDCADPRHRAISVAEHILHAVNARLNAPQVTREKAPFVPSKRNWLGEVEMSQALKKSDYKAELEKAQGKLNILLRQAAKKKVSSLLVFEGWDAAGKGGVIRRLIHALDPRIYSVIPIAAPTEEEQAHHYLWRFWQKLPLPGCISIFDRSWYGRVLVERIEGFAQQEDWQRAYAEINEFEQELAEKGILICKFWMHITKDEQLKRFEKRNVTPHKSWKLTDEDWRNREKWDQYETAANDMIQLTSTQSAPWDVVPANDKYSARVQVLNTLCTRLEALLN